MCMFGHANAWRSEDKLWESVLLFCHVGSWDQTQACLQVLLPAEPSC